MTKKALRKKQRRKRKKLEAFPVKSIVVNPKLLIEALRQFKQSDGMMGGVVIHVGKHDEPILIKSSPDYAWDGNEIVTGDNMSILGAYITKCRLVRIKKPEEK